MIQTPKPKNSEWESQGKEPSGIPDSLLRLEVAWEMFQLTFHLHAGQF